MSYLVHNLVVLNNRIELELCLRIIFISPCDCGIIQQVFTANQTQYGLNYMQGRQTGGGRWGGLNPP